MKHLYRCFDKDGVLLYVGVSKDVTRRMAEHRYYSAWHADVVRVESVEVSDETALSAERSAIAQENPKHNVQHKRFGPVCGAPHPDGGYPCIRVTAHLMFEHSDGIDQWPPSETEVLHWTIQRNEDVIKHARNRIAKATAELAQLSAVAELEGRGAA